MPLKGEPAAAAVAALEQAIKGRERIAAADRQLYIHYLDGIGRSKLTNALIERHLGLRGTGRNWNTVLKLAAALGGNNRSPHTSGVDPIARACSPPRPGSRRTGRKPTMRPALLFAVAASGLAAFALVSRRRSAAQSPTKVS